MTGLSMACPAVRGPQDRLSTFERPIACDSETSTPATLVRVIAGDRTGKAVDLSTFSRAQEIRPELE